MKVINNVLGFEDADGNLEDLLRPAVLALEWEEEDTERMLSMPGILSHKRMTKHTAPFP